MCWRRVQAVDLARDALAEVARHGGLCTSYRVLCKYTMRSLYKPRDVLWYNSDCRYILYSALCMYARECVLYGVLAEYRVQAEVLTRKEVIDRW